MAQKVTKNNTEATTSKLVDELLSQVDPSEILSKDGLLSNDNYPDRSTTIIIY